MNRKLPIGEIFTAALKLPLQHTRSLVLLGLPLLAMLMVFDYVMPETLDIYADTSTLIMQACIAILTGLTLVIAIVGCHRLFLLKENSKPLFWSGNEISYVGWWLLMGFYLMLLFIPVMLMLVPLVGVLNGVFGEESMLGEIVLLSIFIPMYFLMSRWSLVLPAAATDKRGVGIPWAWNLSKGNAWRLTLLIFIIPIIKDLTFEFIPMTDSLLVSFIDNALWLVVGVIEVGLLSLSYEFLVNNQVQEPEVNDTEMPEPEQA